MALIGRAEAIVLSPFHSNLWYTFAFFLYSIHFPYLSSCTRWVLFTLPGRWRVPSKVSAFCNKLYLQMLLEGTCLLVPSTRDFHNLSCMLKTTSIKFLHIVFCLYFFMFQWYCLSKNVFWGDVSLSPRLCFDSEEMRLGST